MSREHTITQAMFLDKEIEVSGMPWCADQPKKVGLASLTAKVLCRAHNSALSPVDEEAVRFAEAMRESFRLLVVRSRIKQKYWTSKKFRVDGPRMERWFLKTLINATCHRGLLIGADSRDSGLPSKSLVEIAFGNQTFEPKAGLYGIYDPPGKKPTSDGISILVFNQPANRVLGAVFSFLGFRLLLFLDKKGPELPVMQIYTATGETSDVIEPTYHLLSVNYPAGKRTSHSIVFDWHA
jgi:hypothetical protein